MDSNIIEILSRINKGDLNEVTQKELLLAIFYEQKELKDHITELYRKVDGLDQKNSVQDSDYMTLAERIVKLEHQLNVEQAQKNQRNRFLSAVAIVLSLIAGFGKLLWDILTKH